MVYVVCVMHVVIWGHRVLGQSRRRGEAFLLRFLQHVLPRGFVRTRHFGFLSAPATARLERVRALLKAPLGVVVLLPPRPSPLCRCCQQPMTFVHCYRPARGPPKRPAVTAGTPQS